MICASVYRLVFIRILLVHLAEKILLSQTLNFGGITGRLLAALGAKTLDLLAISGDVKC